MRAVEAVEWGVLVRLKKFCSKREWSRISELRGSVIVTRYVFSTPAVNSLSPPGYLTLQFYSDTNSPELASGSTGLRVQSHKTAPTSDVSCKSSCMRIH